MMTLSEELQWRGQIKDATFSDLAWLNEPRTFYLGSDCQSSDSLTIGNLAVYMLARRLRKHGWSTVMLVGGATSLIGDPGGKDSERDLKPREEIEANVRGIKAQIERLFEGMDFTLVDNYDWFKDVKYLDFLREVGKSFSMTELLQRDFIASRLGEGAEGISYAEFSYSLIQGYDFWHLFKNYGVELQIGGSDQWGNMLSGVPLIRKKENAEAHAMSMPLVINKATGKKFGKSEEGAVWLDPEKTSPFKFYQFWLNVDDDGLEDYLKIYTEREPEDIEKIMDEHRANPGLRPGQKALALDVTLLVHGRERTESVIRASEALFGLKPYQELSHDDFEELKGELPVLEAPLGGEIAEILTQTGLASSKTEARRFLSENAVYINGAQIPLSKTTIEHDDVIEGHVVIRRGKNNAALLSVLS